MTNHTGLDAYFRFSPQGVIWIVLVQALTALSVFVYFRRQFPSEQSWKTTWCAWLGFIGQIAVLALFFHYETFVAAGSSIYVKELFTIGIRDVFPAGLVARHCLWGAARCGAPRAPSEASFRQSVASLFGCLCVAFPAPGASGRFVACIA